MADETGAPNLPELLRIMIGEGATDLHITTNSPPQIRVDGRLRPVEGEKPLSPKETRKLAYSILTDTQKAVFEEDKELDFSFGVKGLARFRSNVFMQRGAVAMAVRTIPWKILTFEELGLPKVVQDMATKPKGLVLVTGPTGSGKSTTLAAILDRVNSERREHIVTIEDPIEYLHQHKSCIVNQRELHSDTKSFAAALKSILRQDPDVILIGEMRDPETIELALKCAETGHLTFSTLHTNSCDQTINRIIDVFPPHQQTQVRTQLSFVLEGVISQTLIPRASGSGRCLAIEIMVPTPAIRNLIREDKVHQVYSIMQAGRERTGMITLNQCLFDLIQRGEITQEEGISRSIKPEELAQMFVREIAKVGEEGGGREQRRRRREEEVEPT